ncbi:MAG: tRNA pseudouridine(55) synthase TruB [Opitutales bacterium]
MTGTEKKDIEGILLVDKPQGPTSHDVVDRMRRKLKMKRIGHAGTLDPMATGLLILLIGKATKVSQFLISLDKEYEGTVCLGVATNTQDAEGEVMVTSPVPALTEEEVRAAMKSFIGDQYQTPPMHSAIKIKGVPLYKMARKGQEIEREPRFIRVTEFELNRMELPEVDFYLCSSKGTYVRTIAHDLGQKLGCGGHLNQLRRTATHKFHVSEATPLEELEELSLQEIEKKLIPVYQAVPSHVL